VHRAVFPVLGPRAAGDVTTDDGLEREDLEAADCHAAVSELGGQGRGEVQGAGDVGAQEVGFEIGEFGREELEPVGG